MIARRAFITIVGGRILAAPLAAEAQPTGKVYKIGRLTGAWREDIEHTDRAFLDELRSLGWVEGRNVVFEYRFANGQLERLPQLAAELVSHEPDVIVAGTTPAVAAAKQATLRIPIVMGLVRDPVGLGFVSSFARPGGNLTGTTVDVTPEIFGKNVELIREAVLSAAHMTIFCNSTAPSFTSYLRAIEQAARKARFEVRVVEVRGQGDFDAALSSLALERKTVVFVLNDPLVFSRHRQILEVIAKNRMAAIFSLREWVEKGGLMSYGINMADLSRRAAHFVDKILRGAKPGDIPVEQPTKFELVVNLKTAKALGLTIPPSLMARADQVIE